MSNTRHIHVLAGPHPDHVRPVGVNKDLTEPIRIDTDEFKGSLVIRVKEYKGPDGQAVPESGYFDHNSNTWSVQLAGRFMKPRTADEVLFGNIFSRPIRDHLPYGTSLALRAMGYIDPALETDLYSDEPWALSPLLATMSYVHVRKDTTDEPQNVGDSLRQRPEEDCTPLLPSPQAPGLEPTLRPGDPGARRKWFMRKEARESVTLGPDCFVNADFSNSYVDGDLNVKLPLLNLSFGLKSMWSRSGISDVIFACTSRDRSVYFFAVVFRLEPPSQGAGEHQANGEECTAGQSKGEV